MDAFSFLSENTGEKNWGSTRKNFNTPWGKVHKGSHDFFWEHVKAEEDPNTYYLILDSEGKYETDLSGFNRLVVLMDDPWRRKFSRENFLNPPQEVVQVWYGLDAPPVGWCSGEKVVSGAHFWDAYPMKVSPRTFGEEFDVLVLGALKPRRKERLRTLLTNISTYCVGGDWSEVLPNKTYRNVVFGTLGANKVDPENRVRDVREVAVQASMRCKTELVFHDPDIKSFMSIRLPDILRRGACPIVDLDHDPKRLLLLSQKLRDNLYVANEKDVTEAVAFSKSVSGEDLQREYDLQYQRAVSDMQAFRANLRGMS